MTFGAPFPFRPAEPSVARVGTPLGAMVFGVDIEGESVPPSETFLGEAGFELRRCTHPTVDIELLLLPFSPRLPEGMCVDGCVAAVWRARMRAEIALTFRATWERGARIEDGGHNGGEHLTALTWDVPGARLSLGTSDEEALAYAAEDGLLPARLVPVFLAGDGRFAEAIGERDGLEVALPPLLTGETVQIHMVLAWVMGELSDNECSPWFAVDVSPREIARMVDEALGRMA